MVQFLLDHVVLKVLDLAAASADFAALGFTVVPGGEHEGRGSRNALVAFEDGSYLELIAFRAPAGGSAPPATPRDRTVRWREAAEGLVDFALLPRDLDRAIRDARRRGLELLGPAPGGRLRPDGAQVSWRLGLPDGFDLPFLCADLTPRALRVPEGAARKHRNGATGIESITIATADPGKSADRYRALLGPEPKRGPDGGPEFRLGATRLELVTKTGSGEGPAGLALAALDGSRVRELDPERSHGARIRLVPASPAQVRGEP